MSIPMVLISRYYHVGVDDIEVNYGKEIVLHNPMILDEEQKLVKPKKGNKELDEIKIPINKNGYFISYQTLVNTFGNNINFFEYTCLKDAIPQKWLHL